MLPPSFGEKGRGVLKEKVFNPNNACYLVKHNSPPSCWETGRGDFVLKRE